MIDTAAALAPVERESAPTRRVLARFASVFLALGLLLVLAPALVSADPGDIGLPGPSFQGASGSPSGSKPESKLWYNDGYWWASMWDTATSRFAIWRLNPGASTWVRTAADVDTRANSRSDILWDGTKLYIASYQFSDGGSGSGQSRLLRYSYNTSTDTYTLDSGFPGIINSIRFEALTIAKDSTGQLWATWEAGGQIWVNRTTTADNVWGAPFVISGAANVDSDDISTMIAFGGDRIGVMWSNQDDEADYFAVHLDSAADTTWGSAETAYAGTNVADDHLNLKTDSAGRVYAVVKTSLNSSSQPLIVLLVRQTNGTWSNHTVSLGSQPTRPIVVVDEVNSLLRVFYTQGSSGGTINMKTSPIGSISFPGGTGTVVVQDFDENDLNNVTSTKQNATAQTGLVILATNDETRLYWFASILGGGQPPVDTTPPVRTGMTVNGSTLTVTYDEPLDPTSTPATGAYTASVNGSSRGISGVAISGSNVVLTLASPVTNGQDVTLAYAVGANPVQDVPGNDAAGFAATAVTNTTPPPGDTTPPVAGAKTVNGSTLVITYDEALDPASEPNNAAFTVAATSGARAVTDIAISGSAVTLTLASPVLSTDTVTVAYALGGNPIQDVAGNDAAAFAAAGVTNSTPGGGTGGTFTFVPTDDSQVKSNSATANYGNDTTMRLREEAGGVTYRSYVKFNVTGLTGTVSGVKLRLFVTDNSTNTAFVHGTATTWTEGALNWNNAPAFGATALGSAVPATTGAWVEFTLAPTSVSGNGTVAFGIKSNGTTSAIFSTSEAATNRPELVVTTAGGPPPGDTTPPTRTGATVNGASLALTYDEALDTTPLPAATDFTVTVAGSARAVSNVAISGTNVILTLASPVTNGQAVTLSYTAGANPIQDVAENDAANFSNITVTNNTPGGGGGTVIFIPTDDAQVKSNSLNTNYGNDTSLRLREDPGTGTTYRSYVKFNVTGIGGTVTSVKLRLWVSDNSNNTAFVHSAPTTWAEGTLTWSNAPAFGATALGSAVPATTGAWVEINLTPTAVSGNGTYSFGIKSNGTTSAIFNSSEAATNRPELVVTTAP